MSSSHAQTLLERYWEEASNQGNYELVRELCADLIIRHDPEGKTTPLSHDEQIARLKMGREDVGVHRPRIHPSEEVAGGVAEKVCAAEGEEADAAGWLA